MYIIIIYTPIGRYKYTPDGRSPRSLVSQSTGQAPSRTTLRRADGSHREHGILRCGRYIRVLLTRGGGLLCVQRRKAATDTSQYIIIKDSKGGRKDLCTTVCMYVCVCVCVCTRSTTFTFTLVRCTRWFSARLCIGSLTTGRVRNRYTKRALDKTKCHTCLLCRHHCICAGRPSIICSYFSNIINNNMYYYYVHICVYRGRASESDKRSVEGSYLVTPVTGVQYTAAAVVYRAAIHARVY